MGRVVGRNRVERAVAQALDNRLNVLGGSQRWVHSVIRVALQKLVFRERKVMRRGLGGHLNSAVFCVADKRNARLCADVADVNRNILRRGKSDFTRCSAVLCRRRNSLYSELFGDFSVIELAAACDKQVLAVGDNPHPELRRFFHRLAQKFGVFNRSAVVAERNRACGSEGFKVGFFLAFEPLCNARGNVNARISRACFINNILYRFGGIGCGAGVRHREQACNSACRRRAAACDYIFLRGLSRVAEMHVHIHKSRYGAKSFGVNNLAV